MAFKSRVSTGRRANEQAEIDRLKAQVAEIDKAETAKFVRGSLRGSLGSNKSAAVVTRPVNPSVVLLAFNKHIAGELTGRISGLKFGNSIMDRAVTDIKPDGWIVGTDEQEAIWKEIKDGDRHVMVNAVAGSGKTTVLIQACLRGSTNVQAMTYHSLGMKAVGRAFGKLRVDQYKVWGILDEMTMPVGEHQEKMFKARVNKVVSLAKQYGSPDRAMLEWIVDHHDVELNGMEDMVLDLVPAVLRKCMAMTSVIDFDDMIWLPEVLGLDVPRFDIVMSDEAQDLNVIQQRLALKAGDRHVVVGDRNQAIYAFRGADSKSMDSMRETLVATNRGVVDMPLTLTRRCPQSHVAMAQKIVPGIRALDTAPVGKVSVVDKLGADKLMKPGDMVLCRVNAELLMVAYRLLKRGVKAVVRGKDIGLGIIKLIEKAEKESGDGSMSVPDLMQYAGRITDQECSKFLAIPHGRGEMRASAARDKMDCLISISEGARNSREVKDRITELFADFDSDGAPRHAVILSSVHRGKGLEAGRVFILRPDLMPHPMARQAHEVEQEMNLIYIACTRAKYTQEHEGEIIWIGELPELLQNGKGRGLCKPGEMERRELEWLEDRKQAREVV